MSKREQKIQQCIEKELRCVWHSIEGLSSRVWTAQPAATSSRVREQLTKLGAEVQAVTVKIEPDLKEIKDYFARKSAASSRVDPAAAYTKLYRFYLCSHLSKLDSWLPFSPSSYTCANFSGDRELLSHF